MYKLLDYEGILIHLTKKKGSKVKYLILEVRKNFSQIRRNEEKIGEEI